MISTTIRKSVMFSTFLSLFFLTIVTEALSEGEISTSYVSVQTLDHYGNAIQLGHAKEATQRYGRPVIIAAIDGCKEDDNIDISLTGESEDGCRQYETQEIESQGSFVMVVSVGKSPILHPIQLPLEMRSENSLPFLAICFTGVKGDANWLLQEIQKFAVAVWERYDTDAMPVPILARAVARILVKFADKSEQQEWQSSLGLAGKDDPDDRRESSWSRPLGVQAVILSSNSYSLQSSTSADYQDLQRGPGFLIVEPSGRILNAATRSQSGKVSLGAVGKGCDKIKERLIRLLRATPQSESANTSSPSWGNQPPTHKICQDELIRILLEETVNIFSDIDTTEHLSDIDILVEIYSSDRGKIERRLFRSFDGISFE